MKQRVSDLEFDANITRDRLAALEAALAYTMRLVPCGSCDCKGMSPECKEWRDLKARLDATERT